MSENMMIFDRAAVRKNRDRAANSLMDHIFSSLSLRAALASRLDDINKSFSAALDLGCHGGELAHCLTKHFDIKTLIQTDLSPSMAALAKQMDIQH